MEEHKNYSKIQDTHISHMESGTGEQVIQAEITRNEKHPDPKAAQDPDINHRKQRVLEGNERKKERKKTDLAPERRVEAMENLGDLRLAIWGRANLGD